MAVPKLTVDRQHTYLRRRVSELPFFERPPFGAAACQFPACERSLRLVEK
jgi:hypothetical protein